MGKQMTWPGHFGLFFIMSGNSDEEMQTCRGPVLYTLYIIDFEYRIGTSELCILRSRSIGWRSFLSQIMYVSQIIWPLGLKLAVPIRRLNFVSRILVRRAYK